MSQIQPLSSMVVLVDEQLREHSNLCLIASHALTTYVLQILDDGIIHRRRLYLSNPRNPTIDNSHGSSCAVIPRTPS